MKKIHYLGLLLSLSIFVAGSNFIFAQQSIGCGGYSVSSNPENNIGHCMECLQGGDECMVFGGGPACSAI